MSVSIGIDTSNYTTSIACYDNQSKQIVHAKKLLPVKEGQAGLRQSDAVFLHVKQMPDLLREVLDQQGQAMACVGVSTRPRDEDGSYMPCFLVGELVAQSIASALHVPVFRYSHQSGHLAAALYSCGKWGLTKREFLAFHVSGGTTECLHVSPGDGGSPFRIERIGKTLDLNAGQVIDRVGVMLGLAFPCGAALELLAKESKTDFSVKPSLKDSNCCLSGIENQCQLRMERGEDKRDIAKFCLQSVEAAVGGMAKKAAACYPGLPFVFAGGVMSNEMIRMDFTKEFEAYFAQPQFSTDNAAGIAALAGERMAQNE